MVAGRGHPGTLAGAAAVVLPEIPPGAHPVIGEIGVAEIAVEQVEQRLQPLDAERGVARRRRAEIVVHIRRIRQRHARGRHVLLAQGRRALVAEAGEGEGRAAPRGGAEGAELRLGAVVERAVEIGGVGPQAAELGMMGVDDLAGLGVGVAGLLGLDRLLELAVEPPEHDPGDCEPAAACARTPPSPRMHRRRTADAVRRPAASPPDRTMRGGGRGLGGSGSDERGAATSRAADPRGGEQLAATELEVEFGVLRGHGGEVTSLAPYRNSMTVSAWL